MCTHDSITVTVLEIRLEELSFPTVLSIYPYFFSRICTFLQSPLFSALSSPFLLSISICLTCPSTSPFHSCTLNHQNLAQNKQRLRIAGQFDHRVSSELHSTVTMYNHIDFIANTTCQYVLCLILTVMHIQEYSLKINGNPTRT